MKKIGKFMLLVAIVAVGFSCEPNGGVTAPKTLLGEWYCVNNSNLTVTISDSFIYSSISDRFVCQYTHDSAKLYLKRLWYDETKPYYNAECNYYWVGDTLHIENFIETYVAKNPPVFTNIILVRSTSEKPDTEPCNHQCFANGTISDAELTEMIRGPWSTDENSMDFGYYYSDDSLAIYWIGKEDFMAGICKFYHFRVKDGKIWFYTDERIKEIEEPYGSNINFSTCFSLETDCLYIYRFTVDGSNFFPLTLRKY